MLFLFWCRIRIWFCYRSKFPKEWKSNNTNVKKCSIIDLIISNSKNGSLMHNSYILHYFLKNFFVIISNEFSDDFRFRWLKTPTGLQERTNKGDNIFGICKVNVGIENVYLFVWNRDSIHSCFVIRVTNFSPKSRKTNALFIWQINHRVLKAQFFPSPY